MDKECVRFYYGGCDGNQNRFESRETCEIQCKLSKEEKEALLKLPKKCIMPMEYGNSCETVTPKWYFDTGSKRCYPFEYSGCGSDESNRFETQDECEQTCTNSTTTTSSTSPSMMTTQEQQEQEQIEGGQTTTTMTVDEEEEETTVQTTMTQSSSERTLIVNYDFCDQPMMSGNCSQKTLKWFYDKNSKYCRQFEFTGCNGNENKFETRQQCIEICEKHKRRGINFHLFLLFLLIFVLLSAFNFIFCYLIDN